MRYLIVGPSWIGDMVMAQALFKSLLESDLAAEISVLAPAATHALLFRMPEVKSALLSPIAHGKLDLKAHREVGASLIGQFDKAIILPGSLKSALIPWFAKVPVRVGWKGEYRYGLLNDIRRLDKTIIPLMVEQFVSLNAKKENPYCHDYVAPSLAVDETNKQKILNQLSLNPEQRPVLALCPGAAFGPAKQWPAHHYASLAKLRIQQGWQVWIFGGPNDQGVADEIYGQLNSVDQSHCFNLAGKTKLLDMIDLMSCAHGVVSNDSGPMHIAAALKLKVVVVYGSTSPQFTPPLTDTAEIASLNLSCSPCFKRECPLNHLNCLNDLSPLTVNDSLVKIGV